MFETNDRRWCGSLWSALLTVTIASAAIAQPPRVSTRDTGLNDVDRLLNSGRDPQGIGFSRNGSILNSAPQADVNNVDKRALRNLLGEAVNQADRLGQAMRTDYQRYPQIRPLLSELISLQGRATRLTRDVDDGIPLDRILTQFQQLDSDWRLLSHQLTQSPLLSRNTQDMVKRVDALEQQIAAMFKMEPQLDRRALLMELATLDSSVNMLIEELELDPTGGNQIYQIVRNARKLEQQVSRIQGMLLDRGSYDQLVTEYKRFDLMWVRLLEDVRPLQNRLIERSVRNIVDADSRLHDLLWISQKSNRENLRQVADSLMRDVDEFFNRTPLKLLLHIPNVGNVLETADSFYGTVNNFRDGVVRNESDRELLESYQYIEEFGNKFIRDFSALRSQAGRVVLREIEDGIASLRNELHISGTTTSVDLRMLTTSAAALENLADHLNYDVKSWLDQDRQSFRLDALKASSAFVLKAQQFHQLLATRPTVQVLRRETTALNEAWRQVFGYLGYCRTADREHIAYLARDISSTIAALQTPLQL